MAFGLASLGVLAPCYWQPRLQAGDLSSHIYNAWLAQLIESGRTQGLVIAGQTTNILFDLLLSGLFRLLGAEAAQRISISLAVLTFVWGAFAFVSTVAGRRAWRLLPCIAMLAYGWVFHMGFFNFYLSLGLCFVGLALAWELKPKRLAAAVPVLAMAYTAHALPVLWAVLLLAYVGFARRLEPRARALLAGGSVLVIFVANVAVGSMMVTRWTPQQRFLITGADQLWVFNAKYGLTFLGLAFIWGLLLLDLIRGSGVRPLISSVLFQFSLVTAAGLLILPSMVLIPGYRHGLVYIPDRMSLALAVCVCALVGRARPGAFAGYGLAALTLIFFGLLFRDERALNSIENRMQALVNQLPPGQRVLGSFHDPGLRVNALAHMIDRVCVGHCYSYANYEPSTWQFRIRAVARNPFVASTYEDSFGMQVGTYVVKEQDLPLYQVGFEPDGRPVIRTLAAGAPCGVTEWKALP